MSMLSSEQAATRCAAAGDLQEIAVFHAPGNSGMVNTAFARTIMTQQWISRGTPKLIGIYGGNDDYFEILKEIRACLRKTSQA